MTKYVLDNQIGWLITDLYAKSSSLGWPEQEDSDDEHGKNNVPIGRKVLVKRVRNCASPGYHFLTVLKSGMGMRR
jgi:hypothetical protein